MFLKIVYCSFKIRVIDLEKRRSFLNDKAMNDSKISDCFMMRRLNLWNSTIVLFLLKIIQYSFWRWLFILINYIISEIILRFKKWSYVQNNWWGKNVYLFIYSFVLLLIFSEEKWKTNKPKVFLADFSPPNYMLLKHLYKIRISLMYWRHFSISDILIY